MLKSLTLLINNYSGLRTSSRFTNSAAYAIINIGENNGKILFNKTLRTQHWSQCCV
jgi:hypothetical protein